MKKLIQIVKELTKLVTQLDELLVKIIGAVGWVLILIEVLN